MKTLQIIGIFLLIGILNTVISAEYLKLLKLPSGDIAMIPIGIMIVSGISLAISTILILIISTQKQLSLIKSVLIYHIIYFITNTFFGLEWPLSNFSFTNIDFCIIIIGFIVWVFIFAVIRFLQSRKKQTP
ncbi:hypothetical protein [Chryseobacterium viscerum]|uniref:DUF4293 domain-containing protein n=1 Tax=Chryseobacterium viscerum TaxID=1037377 RepID=A0A5N4BP34_9FLAO|nr:hypothetical protein [Chryseobacterium viscerum]KAB1230173.1 hypothetical protein F8D52_13380 [Chryseobacterium viscerum]